MITIKPVTVRQQNQVADHTREYVERAENLFGRAFDPIPIAFDIKGKTAGMYRVERGRRLIRYNPYIFSKYFEDNLANTVPHEVAHYISDVLFGLKYIRPHGVEWKNIMACFGAEPSRTCSYNMDGIPTRQFRTFSYKCGCSDHRLTSRRHYQIQLRRRTYSCRICGQSLAPE